MNQVQQRNLVQLAEDERCQLMAKALKAYDGTEDSINRPMVTRPGQPDDNTAINYASVIVDKGVSFLFGDGINIEIGEQENTAGEELLEEIWPDEKRAEDLIDLGTNGAIFGMTWVKLVIEEGRPRPVVLDPLNMRAKWSPDDIGKVEQYLCQYNTTNEMGREVVRRETTTPELGGKTWSITLEECEAGSTAWRVLRSDIWPYPFSPILHCKNLPKANEFYGKPDLARYVLSLCYYINRVDSMINRIIRVHSHPKPWARGMKAQSLEMNTDEMLFLPSAEATLQLLEMKGDLTGAQAFRKQLREGLAEVTHVPEVSTGKTENIGQLSGRAIKILYGPLIDQTSKKRKLYGRLIKQLVSNMLTISGLKAASIALHWPDPLPADEKESAETSLILKQLGASDDTLLRRHGLDPEHEREKRKLNATDMGRELMASFDRGDMGMPEDDDVEN